jgi:hypothetical protein
MTSLAIPFHPQIGSARPYVRRARRRRRSSLTLTANSSSTALRGPAFADAVDVYAWLCQARLHPQSRRVGIVGLLRDNG